MTLITLRNTQNKRKMESLDLNNTNRNFVMKMSCSEKWDFGFLGFWVFGFLMFGGEKGGGFL